MITVVVDGFGGDNAPNSVVLGAVLAVQENPNLKIILTGKEQVLNQLLEQHKYNKEQIEVVNATDVITNDDVPTVAIRQKTDSSLVKCFDIIKQNEDIAGLVSAGSTGAVLTGAFLKLGRIKGVSRPALCPILPTIKGGVVAIVDIGANMDAKPINLVHFALMGVEYLKSYYNITNPRVALLNVGVEDKKGNELSKATFDILKQVKEINFVGNMEARTLLDGEVDLVVSDGFAGNVLLKSTEGAILSVLRMLKAEIKSSFASKIGYLFMKKSFKNLKGKLDYSDKGGAIFIGCKKVVIKSHGSSDALSIKASINQVVELFSAKLVEKIENGLSAVDLSAFTNDAE